MCYTVCSWAYTPSGRTFLGQFGAEQIDLSLDGLPAHSEVTVAFDLYVIRSWDGNETEAAAALQESVWPDAEGALGPDIWDLTVAGGETLLHTTFSNWRDEGFWQAYPDGYPGGENPARTGAVENDTLGYDYDGERDSVYHLTFTFKHAGPELVLQFSALGLQELEDESWGLDNVEVTLR